MEESEETQGFFSGGKKDFKLLLFFFPFILFFMRGGKKRRMKPYLTQGIEHVKWPGVWGRKEWAGEGKKKSQEQIIRKIDSTLQRKTNQISLFLLPTNKRSIYMEQQI